MKNVVLVGDSIRMYYQPFVQEALQDIATVVGSAENGGNSANVLANFGIWTADGQIDLVHINCGLHDIKKEFGSDEAAIPLEQFKANVRQILTQAKALPGARVVWATITPVIDDRHNPLKGFNRFQADVDAYNAAALEIATELGVEIDDLHAVAQAADPAEILTFDGVHYTEEGSKILAEAVAAFIRAALSR